MTISNLIEIFQKELKISWINPTPEDVYELWHSSREFRDLVSKYHDQFKGNYELILTIFNQEVAKAEVESFKDAIRDKTVVEIGAGIGLLSLEMAKYAKTVYAFELDPAWSWIFIKRYLYNKPDNLHFIFGDAEQFKDLIKSDVVVIYACQDIDHFLEIAEGFDPEIIIFNGDVYEIKKG